DRDVERAIARRDGVHEPPLDLGVALHDRGAHEIEIALVEDRGELALGARAVGGTRRSELVDVMLDVARAIGVAAIDGTALDGPAIDGTAIGGQWIARARDEPAARARREGRLERVARSDHDTREVDRDEREADDHRSEIDHDRREREPRRLHYG